MLISLMTILVACTGSDEQPTQPVEAVQVAVPTVVETVDPVVTVPECVDTTPDDGVEDCTTETVATTTEASTELPTIVVVAK